VKRAITAAVFAIALLSGPANAHARIKTDGNDTASRLDISGIGLGHNRGTVILV
jgi:hypothetical protein